MSLLLSVIALWLVAITAMVFAWARIGRRLNRHIPMPDEHNDSDTNNNNGTTEPGGITPDEPPAR